jgi:hypothetical protein
MIDESTRLDAAKVLSDDNLKLYDKCLVDNKNKDPLVIENNCRATKEAYEAARRAED